MNKCCDNCGNKKQAGCGLDVISNHNAIWDTSKDYCSKWEEKEDKVRQIYTDLTKIIYVTNKKTTPPEVILIVDYFKQRIEESINNANWSEGGVMLHQIITKPEIEEVFSWILGANNEH